MKVNRQKVQEEKIWRELATRIQENLQLTLIVLHNYYGFGEKRINEFITHLLDETQRFNEYSVDGEDVCRTKFERELRALGCLNEDTLEWLCAPVPMFRDRVFYERGIEKKFENKVSFTEAAEMRRQLDALRNLQNGVKPNG